MSKIRQQWSVGAVLSVTTEAGEAFAQMLNHPEMAFFSDRELTKLLFRAWVHKSCYCTGRWLRIGKEEVSVECQSDIPRFIRDAIDGSYSIRLGANERAATFEECKDLECAAVWEASHIEERLSDLAFGRVNQWQQQLVGR